MTVFSFSKAAAFVHPIKTRVRLMSMTNRTRLNSIRSPGRAAEPVLIPGASPLLGWPCIWRLRQVDDFANLQVADSIYSVEKLPSVGVVELINDDFVESSSFCRRL
ncbi:hypothetical protein MCOR25_006089 [Pyricularia grisea]|nr:hypothetical protein MCOR25_006089 [Pyricularia grisea]